ncbi:hypothetical protein DUI87_05028 [Hirundo rustica rustica]|uniref:RNase H type-1 domain-containing protein n=1 Tax=Hirundo rustica rustica TaxID=333673 RepID=A0A3M0LGB5_HIRRU|nr:hypothetical protein DUI87_05028 [Hirundo rustica rustica]
MDCPHHSARPHWKPKSPRDLEIITNWPESENFGLTDEEEQEQVTRAQEGPPYNQLPAEEMRYALFTDSSCCIVGMNRKWKAAVWSPTGQVAQATEGEGGSSQLAELKAVQLALDIAEREKRPKLYLYTDLWTVASALWGWLEKWKKANWQSRGKPIWAADEWKDIATRVVKLPVKVRHVDAHVPKSWANEENQKNKNITSGALTCGSKPQEVPRKLEEPLGEHVAKESHAAIQPNESSQPYSKIKPLRSEPFVTFVERLTQAIELQVKNEGAQEQVLKEVALADANEQCKAAILSLSIELAPTLHDMLQVCARKIHFIKAHHNHSSRVKPPQKAAAADTMPPVPVPQPPPKRRTMCLLCDQAGHWASQCPLKKQFLDFQDNGGRGSQRSKGNFSKKLENSNVKLNNPALTSSAFQQKLLDVIVKDPATRETESPHDQVTWGHGYTCVSTPSGPKWVPAKCVKPFIPKTSKPPAEASGCLEEEKAPNLLLLIIIIPYQCFSRQFCLH